MNICDFLNFESFSVPILYFNVIVFHGYIRSRPTSRKFERYFLSENVLLLELGVNSSFDNLKKLLNSFFIHGDF